MPKPNAQKFATFRGQSVVLTGCTVNTLQVWRPTNTMHWYPHSPWPKHCIMLIDGLRQKQSRTGLCFQGIYSFVHANAFVLHTVFKMIFWKWTWCVNFIFKKLMHEWHTLFFTRGNLSAHLGLRVNDNESTTATFSVRIVHRRSTLLFRLSWACWPLREWSCYCNAEWKCKAYLRGTNSQQNDN